MTTLTYIITKTQFRNDGYSYPVTMVLYITSSKEVADIQFRSVTSRAEPHPTLKNTFIETYDGPGDRITSVYRLHKEVME